MPGSTYSLYDSNGNRVLVQEENLLDTKNITTRQMVYAADGTLLQKNDGKASSLSSMVNNKVQYASITAGGTAHHFSSNGNYLGEIAKDKNGRISSSLKDQHFTGATQHDSSNVIQYQVQSGDSLKSLALNFYGNADYWYLIANLNGLTSSPDEALSAGLSIDIPARASSSNNANSFKPMDLQKIIGDTTPSLPYVPPAPAAGCNAVAMIVMIAITVVATIATAGAAAMAMSGVTGSVMSLGTAAIAGGTALGTSVVAGAGAFAGMSALAVSATAAAVGGFVGSVAGQLAGKAMGVVDSFSLKNAFASGLTAGATAGLGNYVSGMEWAQKAGDATKLGAMGKMTMAASGAGINVAANKLAGNNKASFQWRNVVTGAATAGALDHLQLNNITDPLERFTNSGGFVSDLIHGAAGAAVGYGVSKGLYNEGSWNFRNVATDVFGNALGNSIVSKAQNIAKIQKDAAAAQQGLYSAFQGQETDNFAASLQDKATKISGQLSSEAAKQHDAATEQRLLDADALQQSYLDKGVGAIDDYLDMSRKTQRDIQSINARTATSRQQRATQAAQIQQRYEQRTMDFRMDNPVHRGSNSLLSQEQISTAQALIQQDGQKIAKNKAHLQASSQLDNEFAALKKLTPEINNLFSDKWLEGFIGGPLQPLPSEVASYQAYSSGLTNLSASIGGLGISSNTLGSLLESGWGSSPGIGKEWNMFWNDPQLTMHADWHFGAPALNAFGSTLGGVGIGLSGWGAYTETFGNPNTVDTVDYVREWGKAGLDTAAAATGYVSKLARFSLPGAVYSGLDIAVQLTPGYTVQYGSEAAKLKTGWTKFMYVGADQAEQMRRTNPEMHYQIYIKRDPKF